MTCTPRFTYMSGIMVHNSMHEVLPLEAIGMNVIGGRRRSIDLKEQRRCGAFLVFVIGSLGEHTCALTSSSYAHSSWLNEHPLTSHRLRKFENIGGGTTLPLLMASWLKIANRNDCIRPAALTCPWSQLTSFSGRISSLLNLITKYSWM